MEAFEGRVEVAAIEHRIHAPWLCGREPYKDAGDISRPEEQR